MLKLIKNSKVNTDSNESVCQFSCSPIYSNSLDLNFFILEIALSFICLKQNLTKLDLNVSDKFSASVTTVNQQQYQELNCAHLQTVPEDWVFTKDISKKSAALKLFVEINGPLSSPKYSELNQNCEKTKARKISEETKVKEINKETKAEEIKSEKINNI